MIWDNILKFIHDTKSFKIHLQQIVGMESRRYRTGSAEMHHVHSPAYLKP